VTGRVVRGVVVAYNGEADLAQCLSALAQSIDVIVVDNSSSSAVRDVATAHEARYLDPGTNLGFAAGVNRGLQDILGSSACDVLLLNPDAILEPQALQSLSRAMHLDGNDRVCAVAPRMRGADGHDQRVAWPFPSPLRAWGEAFGLGRLPFRNGFLIGAILLLRWEALQEVGLFDERFFLYAEETDWQRRAAERGWTSLLAETAAEHIGGGASSDPLRREILFHAAQETYIRKWYGRRGWFIYRAATCAGAAARTIFLGGERRAEAARRVRLYVRGPRRCAALTGR
jgi:GT2 family glycosyltransferase